MRSAKRALAAVVAVVAVAGAAGCSGGQGDGKSGDRGPVKIGAVPTPTADTDEPLPLDAYLPTKEQEESIQRAKSVLVSTCMKRFGFTYPAEPVPDPVLAMIRSGGEGALAFRSESEAAQYGYHPKPESGEGQAESGSGAATGGDRAVMELVLTGKSQDKVRPSDQDTVAGKAVPEGGCVGEADAELAEGAPAPDTGGSDDVLPEGAPEESLRTAAGNGPVNAVLALRGKAADQVTKDERFVEMIDGWKKCMKTAGYPLGSLSAAAEDPRWSESTTATQEEKNTAVADMRCRLEVNYLGIDHALDSAYQQRMIEENGEMLESVRSNTEARVKNAAALLGQG
ncbi:hypothetical protein [Streptomyces sp. NPDC058411]|uniref:hypothetical protein n=1 Tax=Streptomyces sp. NPDC058411 TaxID=3346485 RepID=UPI0036582C21